MNLMSRKSAFGAALVLLAGLGMASAVQAATQSRAFRQVLPATEADQVRLANLAGRIEIIPGQGREVVVEATTTLLTYSFIAPVASSSVPATCIHWS